MVRPAGSFTMSLPKWLTCLGFTLLLVTFCFSKVIAEYNVYQAEHTGDSNAAYSYFRIASMMDPEYAGLYLSAAARNMADNEPGKAAENTRKAIENGVGMALTYSALAKQQVAAGDISGADATYQESLRIYPRSIFLRTEFIVFLEKQGRSDDAAKHKEIARATDLKAANGWYQLITNGSVATFYLSQRDENVMAPANLVPADAVTQYVDPVPEHDAADK